MITPFDGGRPGRLRTMVNGVHNPKLGTQTKLMTWLREKLLENPRVGGSIPSPATIREASKRKPCNGFGLAGLFVYSRPNLKTSAFAKNNSADELADRL